MGSAAKSTSAQPSTNIPIQCPECGTKPMAQFFWKYKGMMAHWQRAHSTKTMPVELSEQLKISEKEKGGLVKFAKSSGAGAAKRKRASDAAAAPAATAAAARRLSAACEPKETAVAAAESVPKEAAEEARRLRLPWSKRKKLEPMAVATSHSRRHVRLCELRAEMKARPPP